jgi:histidine triad (HIT) family protein
VRCGALVGFDVTDTDCVFCDIVGGDGEALVVDECDGGDERAGTLASAPLDPVASGHVLVVPKAHHESLFDVSEDVLAAVTEHARLLARRFRGGEGGFDGANVLHDSSAQQSVPHLHLDVVGRREGDRDLWPETEYDGSKRDAYDAVTVALEAGPARPSTPESR